MDRRHGKVRARAEPRCRVRAHVTTVPCRAAIARCPAAFCGVAYGARAASVERSRRPRTGGRLRRLGRIHIACTQQMATIWLRLYEITRERRWLDAVDAVLRFLKSTQNRATENRVCAEVSRPRTLSLW